MATRGPKPKSDSDSLPYLKFYPGDWLRSPINMCSPEAQLLWLRMMMLAHDGTPYGHLRIEGKILKPSNIATRCGVNLKDFERLLSEITDLGIHRTDDEGCIFWPQMVLDHKKLTDYRHRKRDFRQARKDMRRGTIDGTISNCPEIVPRKTNGQLQDKLKLPPIAHENANDNDNDPDNGMEHSGNRVSESDEVAW